MSAGEVMRGDHGYGLAFAVETLKRVDGDGFTGVCWRRAQR
jgi:hypothetical protein